MAHGWRIQEGMEDWIRATDKKIAALERRPVVQQSSDIMGPTLGPYVQAVTDCNASVTAINGFFYVPIGTPNSPNPARGWMVQTIAQADGYGIQQAEVIHDNTGNMVSGNAMRRRFWAPGASVPRIFTAWVSAVPPVPQVINLNMQGAWPSSAPPNSTTGTPFTCNFAGTLTATFQSQGFVAASGTNLWVDIYIDGVNLWTMRSDATNTASVRLAAGPATIGPLAITAGNHYCYFRTTQGSSSTSDFGSMFGVLVPTWSP